MSAKIAAAIHQVMSACGYVQKTGRNTFHNYRYAGEADLLEKLRPAMLDAGLILLPSVKKVSATDDNGNVTVEMEYTLIHKDGDVWPEKIGAAGCGNDRSSKGTVGDKGLYKAITGANKYLLFKLFQIETGDDPENDSKGDPHAAPKPEPAAPQPEPEAGIAYVKMAKQAMGAARTLVDLNSWWAAEQPNRVKYRLDARKGPGLDLSVAYGERKAELKELADA